MDDRTIEVPLAGDNGELTVVTSKRVDVLPTAKLLVSPNQEIPLSRAKDNLIGRDSSNVAVIKDRQASRQHARITCSNGDFWIEDLNSLNGTRLNGVRIQKKQKLTNNDQIGVGDDVMFFTLESV
jgi:pSer/pThr/pTyr-binding forkhead associated (FHA) protein